MNADDTIMVIGSSGFLGRWVTGLLGPTAHVVPTHCRHRCFPTSMRYDFFRDEIGPTLDRLRVSIVIFAAAVEARPEGDLAASIERFVRGCGGRRLVYLSSDAVFDGQRGLYGEEDAPTPCTPYGHHLLLCERCVAAQAPNYCIVRPSYIYGFSAGQLDKRLEPTRRALQAGEEVARFDDMYKSPLGVQQVAEAVIRLCFSGYLGIVHVAGERLSVYDFHRRAMEAIGVDTRRLRPCAMPAGEGYLPDTSLRTDLWQELTGMRPLGVQETLAGCRIA